MHDVYYGSWGSTLVEERIIKNWAERSQTSMATPQKSSGLKMTHQLCLVIDQTGWPFIPPPLSLVVGLPKGVTRVKVTF